jgi:AcrR family transcriptional regulator
MPTGLRERRKQETRQAISDIATRMFADRGFEVVTISQVAEAAGVSKMTVTNYFPRKEDLVFNREEMIIGGLAHAVQGRAAGESLLDAVRRDYARSLAEGDVTTGVSGRSFARMVDASPVLTARLRELLELREQALGDAIAAELGDRAGGAGKSGGGAVGGAGGGGEPGGEAGEPGGGAGGGGEPGGRDGGAAGGGGGVMCRMVAAQLASVHRVLYAEATRRSLAGQPREDIVAVLGVEAERAFDLLEPSLGRYQVRTAAADAG